MKAIYKQLAIGLVLIALGSGFNATAQYEPMFTQYMFNELFVNPAYAGSRENMSATGMYRTQWVGLDGAPTTQTISIHGPVLKRRVGLGLSMLNESIGVTKQTGAYLSGAYRMMMKKGTLSFALQLGLLSHIERLASITTDTPGDAQFLANTDRVLVPNFGFGAYYKTDTWYIGLSVPRMMNNHLKATAQSTDVTNKVTMGSWHYFLTGGWVKQISPTIKLRPNAMIKLVAGAPIQVDVTCDALFRDFVWAGLAYRSGDAASLLLGVYATPQLRIGYAYDYTLNQLQRFNSGSHEIMLGYDFGFKREKLMTPRFF
jgi:type IX secretion system PorP/SprF family membrane protein